MDIRNVAIITDGKRFQKSDVVKIIREEGYKHNFAFLVGARFGFDDLVKHIGKCEEVWCFGNCEGQVEYRVAKELGADIWQMG